MNGAERRRDPRAKVWAAVRYCCLDEGRELWHEGTLNDVSVGGVRLTCDRALECGARLALELRLPARPEPLLLQGQITWVAQRPSGSECGLQFLDVTPEQQAEIDAFVQFLLQKRTPS